jgi:cupin 2 domain-containing protein
MPPLAGNLTANLPFSGPEEVFEPLLEAVGFRLERIVSAGQSTPVGEWLVQDWDEWVVLIAGEAKLLVDGELSARVLQPGDWNLIRAGVRHRVEWTSNDPPAVWLALHYNLPNTMSPHEG